MSRCCSLWSTALATALTVVIGGCGGEDKQPPAQWPDADVVVDSGPVLDGRANDLGARPDVEVNTEGPKIEILAPKETDVAIKSLIKVQANISDPDGVDDQTVNVTPAGRTAVRMAVTSTPGLYEALIDIGSFGENVRIWVSATDLAGNTNTAFRDFKRDPGPVIQVNAPAPDSRHKGSVSLQVLVADKFKVTLFAARIGSVTLDLKKTDLGQGKALYSGSVKFDDPVFSPPLSGQQVITFTAENENGARNLVDRAFFVDDAGPQIAVSGQSAGQLIGGIIQLTATVTDPAGVVASSVKCVIGNNLDKRTVQLKATSGSTTYTGQFDTRTLTQFDLWPVMSFRAADALGNESHRDFQVGLDNGPPTIALDPSADFWWGIDDPEKGLQCSHPFDPVGEDAANDLELVPQIIAFRARIEDHGNHVPSAPWVPVSLVNAGTARMFLLDDTSQALVIDTTGDGYCDSVNPEVVPLGSAPALGQAVAIDLTPIGPTGAADFTPYPVDQFTFAECKPGDAEAPPDPLCPTTVMTRVIPWSTDGSVPAIYTIPPVGGGFQCVGLPFDFLANSFDDGWVCVAAEAADNLGNANVSRPIRVWVKKDEVTRGEVPAAAGTAPNCTGTLDPTTGQVDSSKPCAFRPLDEIFPQVYPDAELVIEKK